MNNAPRVCVLIILIVFVGIRSNSQVSQAWASTYKGAGGGYDDAHGLAIDRSGNTYVTGEVYTGVNNDCVTIKYKANGDTAWMRFYNGAGNSVDIGWAIAVDTAGYVYVTGTTHTASNSYDIVTIKYDSAGAQKWASTYDGPGHGADEGTAIVLDASGNIYITGHSPGTSGSDDYVTIKYNSAGTQQWATRYDGPGHYHDLAHAIAIDNSGNVYITGQSSGSGTGYDYATIKYNSAGTEQWAARYDDSLHDDVASSLALDSSGNVYVTGSSQSSISHGGWATIKYNSVGTQQWIARYDSGDDDAAYALLSDGESGLFVTGACRSSVSPYSYDYLTIRYDASTGDTVWSARYNGPGNGDDNGKAIALDGLGNVFVTGYSTGVSTGYDYATLRYNSSGVQQWAERYTTTGNYGDTPVAIAVDAMGNVYVTGSGGDATEYDNYLTVKYQDASLPVELTSFSATVADGFVQLEWTTATEVNNYGFEIERRQVQNWSAIGFVAGSGSTGSPRTYSYEDTHLESVEYSYRIKQINQDGTFKFTPTKDVVFEHIPHSFLLEQNYPNPFNPTTIIRFSIEKLSIADLKIYDVLGREVATLANKEMPAGMHEVSFDASKLASGIYFYRLSAGKFTATKKLLLMK